MEQDWQPLMARAEVLDFVLVRTPGLRYRRVGWSANVSCVFIRNCRIGMRERPGIRGGRKFEPRQLLALRSLFRIWVSLI